MKSSHFISGSFDRSDFLAVMEDQGYVVVEKMVSDDFCKRMIEELKVAIDKEAAFHGSTSYKDYGALLACPIYGGSFLELADDRALMEPFNWILGETCIIYVYTSSSVPPGQKNYTGRIHVDRPHFIPGYTESVGCLVLLDDFTEGNGATYVLPGSHKTIDTPDKSYFYKNAIRIAAPRGSVFYFNLRLWHAGGHNSTEDWRHCVGMGMVRAHLKQRIDLPRALEKTDLTGISNFGLQKLGFFAQPPCSLIEYYSSPKKRTYSQRSEWEQGNTNH
jgi:ectoine hydroxylase-related dioxygenase (phytanoyl-CoA dioxygenase family)